MLLLVVAFVVAIDATEGLTQPVETDFFRDMGAAQALLDRNALGDPAYVGEIRWYNPLVPALVAGIHQLSGVPLSVLFTKSGPYLNLLTPIALLSLGWVFFGAWPAIASLAGYLFLGSHTLPSYAHATYSPWLWPANFSPALFLLTLLAYQRHCTRPDWWTATITGFLLGACALAHTGPALIGASVIALSTANWIRIGQWPWKRGLIDLSLIAAVAMLISAPFLAPLIRVYGFEIVHPAPLQFSGISLGQMLRDLASPRFAIALLGVIALGRRARREPLTYGIRIWLYFAVVALAWLTLTVAASHLSFLGQALPAYHFHIYFKLAECMLFGVGCWVVAVWLSARPWSRWKAPVWCAVMITLLVVTAMPGYLRRPDFVDFPQASRRFEKHPSVGPLYHWALENSRPSDVFIAADPMLALFSIAAAGRKLVAMPVLFSNPYVDYGVRWRDQEAMRSILSVQSNQPLSAFRRLAKQYDVTFVVTRRPVRGVDTFLHLEIAAGDVAVYRYDALALSNVLSSFESSDARN